MGNNPINFTDPLGLVEVRWLLTTQFGDPDTACYPTKTGGACSKFNGWGIPNGECKQGPDCKWRGTTIFYVSADITVWGGKFPYKSGAVDKKVKDAESAFSHEFYEHLFPGLQAALKVLRKFEGEAFDDKGKCDAAMKAAIQKAAKDFMTAAKRSPL